MTDGEPAQQHDLAEIPQCQPVAQSAEHHEGNDVARQRRSVEGTVTSLVELLAAVPAPDPDWGDALGYSGEDLAGANRAAISMMHALRDQNQRPRSRMLVSGC